MKKKTVTASFIMMKIATALGAVHKLRHPIRGYGWVSQKMTQDDGGVRGGLEKMTDDDDVAGGRREKAFSILITIRHSNQGNVAVKVKPCPSQASKIAPR